MSFEIKPIHSAGYNSSANLAEMSVKKLKATLCTAVLAREARSGTQLDVAAP